MIHPALVADPSPTASVAEFKQAMQQLAGGVAIITAGRDDVVTGMTVSSLVSLSFDPPTVMVSVNRSASSWPLIQNERVFGASILRSDHVALAERFSGGRGLSAPRRFDRKAWTVLSTGAPILRDALAAFDCEVERVVDHRSYSIVIAQVVEVRMSAGGGVLTYWNGNYSGLEGEEDIRLWAEVGCPSSRGLWEI
ncbi:flavin reductase family protein [Bradyrhizobium sp. LHD-71]|uniref:flavin reductase family protein n=1 Tax=Bradyrhizobium sp. LHD-71 TaxID=3072141 RepID=UPI00280F58A2|nr:flavin reductase family protein [Bradyrhizobium sp. LHD-71]MDQ8728171.1 flavin reductase family protein [Bradyrhizobium sp. LHD-71]